MRKIVATTLTAATVAIAPAPALADSALEFENASRGGDGELPAYIQCVPYARAVSGIQIYGDAYTWWDQAEGHYRRGHSPRPGAVMAFRPYGNMKLGHVAAVSRVIDSRTVLLRHANWSPIDGQRGRIEDDVRAVDVSANNDWSEVRVWYAPADGLGDTVWPVEGFIYPDRPAPAAQGALLAAASAPKHAPAAAPARASVALSAPVPAAKPQRDVIGAIIRGEY